MLILMSISFEYELRFYSYYPWFSFKGPLCRYTESFKYYARIQTAVAGGLGMPAARLAGHHSDAASKHSLCYFRSFPESRASTYICKAETLAFTDCHYG